MADTLLARCGARLTPAPCKCPRTIEYRPSLPKTPIGEALKRELRSPPVTASAG